MKVLRNVFLMSLLIFTIFIVNFHYQKSKARLTYGYNQDHIMVDKLVRVHDGDTFTVDLKGVPAIFGKAILILSLIHI
mgnify:CR=1 FL=1